MSEKLYVISEEELERAIKNNSVIDSIILGMFNNTKNQEEKIAITKSKLAEEIYTEIATTSYPVEEIASGTVEDNDYGCWIGKITANMLLCKYEKQRVKIFIQKVSEK